MRAPTAFVARARTLGVPLALIGMVGCTGLALGRIYDSPLLAQLFAGAGAASVLISVAAYRLPAWTAGPLSVAGLFGYTLIAVRVSAQAADVPGDLATVTADAARNGIPRLLTALIPVEPQPDTVLVPVVAAWLAGLAGAELAVRGRRVLLGYAAPTLCYAAALYVVGPNATTAVWPTLAYAGLAAMGLAASGRAHTGPEPDVPRPATTALRARVATGAAATLAALVALAVAVGPLVANRVATTPEDPRRHVVPPHLDALDENPLIRLSGWAVNPEQHLFDATVDSDTRIRLAVLSDFDGVTWQVGATYRGAGRTLPPSAESPAAEGAAFDLVRQRITIADLSGHLLPAVGVPRRVDGVRVAFDTASGTLVLPDGMRSDMSYAVTSQQPKPDANQLAGAEVPAGPAVARLLRLGPGVPDEIERLARQVTEGNAGAYQRASAIEQFLAEHYRLSTDAPSGHAYPNLRFFLFGARNAGGQRGTSEQFAAAFAVLARLVGLPTRVVVGFAVKAGTAHVTGADGLAWPEVLFTGLGWVPFHPLPEPNTEARPVEEDFRPKPETSNPPPSAVPTVDVSLPPPTLAAKPAPPAQKRHTAWPLVAGSLGGVVLLGAVAFAFAVPLLRRNQRRRRLDRGPPPERVAGAWLEMTDALRLAGRPAANHLAAAEVVEHAGSVAALPRFAHKRRRVRLPVPPPLDDLSTVVNATVFGPTPPGEEEAGVATRQALGYVDELRSRRSWWRRLLWTLHPGPLWWHRR